MGHFWTVWTRILYEIRVSREDGNEPGTGSKSFRPFTFKLGQRGLQAFIGCLLCGLCRTMDVGDDVEAPNRPMLLLPTEFGIDDVERDEAEHNETGVVPVCATPAGVPTQAPPS